MIIRQAGKRSMVPPTRALGRSRRRGAFFYRRFIAAAREAMSGLRCLRSAADRLLAGRDDRGEVRYGLVPVRVRGQREKGQTLIEFAFVFPLLFLFVLLIVDFGFALNRREVIQHAVREGARVGAVGSSVNVITDATEEQGGGVFDTITVCYVDANSNNPLGGAGDSVRVSGSYTHDFAVGGGAFFGPVIPDLTMTPSAEARLEKRVPSAAAC